MKHLNVVVFVVAAAAVLVAAYAVGLLVRQARTPNVEPPSQEVSEPNAVTSQDAVAASRRAGRGSKEPTEEERAAARQARAEQLAKMQNLTDEEKQQFRDEIRQQFTRDPQGQRRSLSEEELAQIALREAVRKQRRQGGQGTQATPMEVNESSQGAAVGERAAEEETSEPNTTDQN